MSVVCSATIPIIFIVILHETDFKRAFALKIEC